MAAELTAEVLLDAYDRARALERASFEPLLDLAIAEEMQIGIAVARLARGERQAGYKIGFTNRSLWNRYGVFHPIWAPIWNTTLRHAAAAADSTTSRAAPVELECARFAQPRIEPEIVVGLRRAPARDTPEAVLEAAEWIAHGFEVVQCPFPDWRFSAAEAIAAQGLHGMLIVGPKLPLSAFGGATGAVLDRLADCEVELSCDGVVVERGRGADALDGPMHAIAHLAHEFRLRGRSIEPGSIIATGTLTDAQPLRAGHCWTTRVSGVELPGLELRTH